MLTNAEMKMIALVIGFLFVYGPPAMAVFRQIPLGRTDAWFRMCHSAPTCTTDVPLVRDRRLALSHA
jgi:hypothetical protein